MHVHVYVQTLQDFMFSDPCMWCPRSAMREGSGYGNGTYAISQKNVDHKALQRL